MRKDSRTVEDHLLKENEEFKRLARKHRELDERLTGLTRRFLLSKEEGLSNSEISVKLDITKKTVENLLSTAKSFINRSLVDEHLISLFFFWFFIR